MTDKVQLGFYTPSGEPYYVPIHHTVITGMTTSGKTTAGERILRGYKGKSLVFLTKRGEKIFQDTPQIPPYYRERFDWEYMRSLLEATMKERLKFETPWIIRIAKQTQVELKMKGIDINNLAPGEGLQVAYKLLGGAIQKEKMREFDRNQYILLHAYLGKVLPTLLESQTKFSQKLELHDGVNTMDVTEWYLQEEVQMLCMRASMEYLLQEGKDTLTALPEAWKIIPQERNTPVKLIFEKFVREGATNNNYLLIDAQDLRGVDKTHLGQCYIWIIGKMIEANEVERLLKQTLSMGLKAETIQKLPLGHFIVVNGLENTVDQVYVWPHGVPEEMAIAVAKGTLKPEVVKDYIVKERERLEALKEAKGDVGLVLLEKKLEELAAAVERNEQRRIEVANVQKQEIADLKEDVAFFEKKIEDIHERSQTTTVDLEHKGLTINVHHEGEEVVKMSTKTVFGKLLYCAVHDLPKEGFTANEMSAAINENGWEMKYSTLTANLSILASQGKLVKTEKGYRLPTKVKFNIQKGT